MNKIAVIMPVYKAHETIKNTLLSIGMQRIVEFQLYMVVDGEEHGSYDYLQDYADLDIDITYLDTNVGPGVARQHGIDKSTEPLIAFIDSDDTFISSLALYYQQLPFKEESYAMVSCDFIQENKDHTARLRERDMVWMHGKMYRRAFLDKYDIRFNLTRANEDVGFNTQCQCYANEKEQIYLNRNVTYMWQWRDNSIVRTDNQSYAFNESIDGYVINKLDAFDRVITRNGIDEPTQYFMIKGITHLFRKYLLAMFRTKKDVNHVKKWAKKYYKAIYPQLDKEYIEKAEKTILAQTGLDKVEHYEEFVKWKAMLITPKKKRNGSRKKK